MKENVLVNAFRNTLYTPDELLGGFDATNRDSFADTLDFRVYKNYVTAGQPGRADYSQTIVQSLHDNSVTYAMRQLLINQRVSAVMGGHRTPRDSEAYAAVARMARALTRAGVLMCSGGGPGAMEATHLGSSLSELPDNAIDKALKILASQPELPPGVKLVMADGTVNKRMLHKLHDWQKPAFEVAATIKHPGLSMAIPTWHYGHEPPTPLAPQIAKYFQNSLREDGLLAIAKQGVIFTEGRAGTMQEVFQDAAQNYYKSYEWFSPMVFYGVDYWTTEMPVMPLLQRLFKEDFERYVLLTDSADEAVTFVTSFIPPRS